jgi:protein involved in polysaccharide export with SLBB domain
MRCPLNLPRTLLSVVTLAAVCLLTGCGTTSPGAAGETVRRDKPLAADVLRVGDIVVVTFSNVPQPILPHEEKIKDDGTITLPLIGTIQAAGKTAGQLQKEIQDAYVPKYYRNMTVTVKPPERQFYVQGEVKLPNRYQLTPGMTVLKAISTAGGFTDFAKRQAVELTSATGEQYVVDCKKALTKPSLDLPIYPDDRINVPKRFY